MRVLEDMMIVFFIVSTFNHGKLFIICNGTVKERELGVLIKNSSYQFITAYKSVPEKNATSNVCFKMFARWSAED